MSISNPKQTNPSNPSSLFCSIGSETSSISDTEIKTALHSFLDAMGPRDEVLLIPPDFTRFHSQAGKITRFICEYYNFVKSKDEGGGGEDEQQSVKNNDNNNQQNEEEEEEEPEAKKQKVRNSTSNYSPDISILPALGTHVPMTGKQIETMFGEELSSKEPNPFLVHDWRKDVVTIGHAPAQMVSDATSGKVNRPWPAQLNKRVWEMRKTTSSSKKKPLIVSVGQVVPHANDCAGRDGGEVGRAERAVPREAAIVADRRVAVGRVAVGNPHRVRWGVGASWDGGGGGCAHVVTGGCLSFLFCCVTG